MFHYTNTLSFMLDPELQSSKGRGCLNVYHLLFYHVTLIFEFSIPPPLFRSARAIKTIFFIDLASRVESIELEVNYAW